MTSADPARDTDPMKPAVRAVLDQIAALPPEDREAVAWELELLVPRRPFAEAESAELRRRLAEYEAGRDPGLSRSEVTTSLRRMIEDFESEQAPTDGDETRRLAEAA